MMRLSSLQVEQTGGPSAIWVAGCQSVEITSPISSALTVGASRSQARACGAVQPACLAKDWTASLSSARGRFSGFAVSRSSFIRSLLLPRFTFVHSHAELRPQVDGFRQPVVHNRRSFAGTRASCGCAGRWCCCNSVAGLRINGFVSEGWSYNGLEAAGYRFRCSCVFVQRGGANYSSPGKGGFEDVGVLTSRRTSPTVQFVDSTMPRSFQFVNDALAFRCPRYIVPAQRTNVNGAFQQQAGHVAFDNALVAPRRWRSPHAGLANQRRVILVARRSG